MELKKAFEFAVILAWDDLMKVVTPTSVRVEYRGEPGTPLAHVTVWADKGKGYQDRVCDYSTSTSPTNAMGIRFWRGHTSDRLAERLGFILTHQDRFWRAADAGQDGLVLVYPPADEDRKEAMAWLNEPPTQPHAADPAPSHRTTGVSDEPANVLSVPEFAINETTRKQR